MCENDGPNAPWSVRPATEECCMYSTLYNFNEYLLIMVLKSKGSLGSTIHMISNHQNYTRKILSER